MLISWKPRPSRCFVQTWFSTLITPTTVATQDNDLQDQQLEPVSDTSVCLQTDAAADLEGFLIKTSTCQRGSRNVLRGPVWSRSWDFEICILTSPTKTDFHSLPSSLHSSRRPQDHLCLYKLTAALQPVTKCQFTGLKSYKYICGSQEQAEVTFVLLVLNSFCC